MSTILSLIHSNPDSRWTCQLPMAISYFLSLSYTVCSRTERQATIYLYSRLTALTRVVFGFLGPSISLGLKHKMDVVSSFSQSDPHAILSVEMHTTGEPVRIIYHGYPELSGTLMEQRRQAKLQHDAVRQRLMSEPRGHNEMLVIFPLR